MARIPREAVDAVRERTDIAEVVGRHVKLARRGQSYVGLCPFHQEKSPSFNVIPHKGIFHCFGCQASGDVFKFLQLISGLSFAEAVRELATAAGVEIEERELSPAERASLRARATLYDVLEEAAGFYESVLWTRPEGEVGRKYLEKRALTPDFARKSRLGFAPAGWTTLVDHLQRKGYPSQLAADAGLARKRDNGTFYDAFRERLLFPIRDERARPIGFGGRILEGDGPKYINSPETRLYQKGVVLYGLDVARAAIQQKDRVIVVEGYFDVLSLQQAGFGEAIATCGTAMTLDHLKKLRRWTRNVILLLDADEAGMKAAEKVLPAALEAELVPWRLTLPGAKDPDELVREQGPAAMEAALKGKEPLLEWTLGRKLAAAGSGAMAREKVTEEVLPWLARVDDRELHHQVARRLGVPEPTLDERIQRLRQQSPGQRTENPPPPDASGWKPHRDVVHLLWLLVHRYGQTADLVQRALPVDFTDHEPVRRVVARLLSGEPAAAMLPEIGDAGVARALSAVAARETLYTADEAPRAACEVLVRFLRPARSALLAELTTEVADCLRRGDTDAYRRTAARRAALVSADRELERALAAGDLARCADLLARPVDAP